MFLFKIVLCAIIFLTFIYNTFISASDLRIREDSKFFARVFLKINTVEYTRLFAYGVGYKVSFDLRQSKKPKFYSENDVVTNYFHPEHVRRVTELLFNLYGWNGTACTVRTLCEIYEIPEFSSDVLGPAMKLLYFGTKRPNMSQKICQDAVNCPVSIFQVLNPEGKSP